MCIIYNVIISTKKIYNVITIFKNKILINVENYKKSIKFWCINNSSSGLTFMGLEE